jgi:hypothetical protein
MIDGSTGGSDGSKSCKDESELEDALEDQKDLVDCFEGVGKVEGLVGDRGEVLGGEVQGVTDDDGSGGESGVGGGSNGVEGNSGGENCVSNGGGCDDAIVGENNRCNGGSGGSSGRGGRGGRGGSGGSGGKTRASNGNGGVRSDVAADCRGAGNRGGGTSHAFQTPIGHARCGNDGEESCWSFENIMGMMMMQQSGDREAREMEHRLHCKEMVVQREEAVWQWRERLLFFGKKWPCSGRRTEFSAK